MENGLTYVLSETKIVGILHSLILKKKKFGLVMNLH